MSDILKDEEFVAVEAGVAPPPVAAVFNELAALRAELVNRASRRVITTKP